MAKYESTELDGTIGGNKNYNTQMETYKMWIDNPLNHPNAGRERPYQLQPGKYVNKMIIQTNFLNQVSEYNYNAKTAKQAVNALDELIEFHRINELHPLNKMMAAINKRYPIV